VQQLTEFQSIFGHPTIIKEHVTALGFNKECRQFLKFAQLILITPSTPPVKSKVVFVWRHSLSNERIDYMAQFKTYTNGSYYGCIPVSARFPAQIKILSIYRAEEFSHTGNVLCGLFETGWALKKNCFGF